MLALAKTEWKSRSPNRASAYQGWARHHKGKRGQRTFKEVRGLPIVAQFNIHSLKKMLELYNFRQEQPSEQSP